MRNHQSLKEHIQILEETLLDPEIRTDPIHLDKLLAEEFFEFGSSGNVWVRGDCLGEGGLSDREFHLYDFKIEHLAEDIVLATYRLKDSTRQQNTLRSSIWKEVNGSWQIFFHQGTITTLEKN
ncbi:DUF4440 domain-containing protein [Bacillus sp. BHET2]|uniref:nuclear transport factor 2 family protein n=1 Tax=Bacillus sp. BHET2 TaxID=2583818 RepID=UPI00110D5F42|nr:DUF4440 domain-containing protein [Bacillus sp. BHET2]TMU88164.1 DUF4440 domain-containing protein [Bacillus sp. BHET2]